VFDASSFFLHVSLTAAGLLQADGELAALLRRLFTAAAAPLLAALHDWAYGAPPAPHLSSMTSQRPPQLPACLTHVAYEAQLCGRHMRLLAALAANTGKCHALLPIEALLSTEAAASTDQLLLGCVLRAGSCVRVNSVPMLFCSNRSHSPCRQPCCPFLSQLAA
jgi:hypothetical protein